MLKGFDVYYPENFIRCLPETSFFRIHHSYIVNMGFIKKKFKDGRGGYVELIDGTTIPVAQRRKDIFLSKFRFN